MVINVATGVILFGIAATLKLVRYRHGALASSKLMISLLQHHSMTQTFQKSHYPPEARSESLRTLRTKLYQCLCQ